MNSRKDTTRKLNIETLAKREVFAANVLASMALPVEKIETMIPAWHNVDMPSDVNRDGAITPMDALFRINSLNQDGARKLPASKPASAPFYDANGDDWLSPVDAIAVIIRQRLEQERQKLLAAQDSMQEEMLKKIDALRAA